MLCVYQQPPPQPLPRPANPAPPTQHNCGVTAIPIHCLSLLVQPLHSGGEGRWGRAGGGGANVRLYFHPAEFNFTFGGRLTSSAPPT